MKNGISRNRSLIQLNGYHDAQHRHARSKILEVQSSNSESQSIPSGVTDGSHLPTPLDDCNLNADGNSLNDTIPEIFF
jgi:hypothetical protein